MDQLGKVLANVVTAFITFAIGFMLIGLLAVIFG